MRRSWQGLVLGSLLAGCAAFGFGAAATDMGLVDAVKKGDHEAVRSMIKNRADVNAAQADGATPLAWAVHKDDQEAIDLLIKAKADVNAANAYGVTPLSLACTNGNAETIKKLLDAGANSNLAQWTGESPLHTCVATRTTEGVKALLAHKADPNVRESEKDQTPLMWAAAKKFPEGVKALLGAGADVHARSKLVKAPEPFKVACTEKDPCLNGQKTGYTYEDTVHFPEASGGFTALLFAAQQGDVESAKLLLDAGADVNEGTKEEGTALVIAAASGHEAFSEYMLDRGANPNAKDGYGITPLHYAVHEGLLAISSWKPLVTDQFGWQRPNMPGLAKSLLAHGADPNAKIEYDFSPYDYAPISRSNGNDLPQISLVGATPFFLAAAVSDISLMKTLVEGRANAKLTTFENTTPLMVAAGVAHERGGIGFGGQVRKEDYRSAEENKKILDSVKMAVELGGDVNAVNTDGKTALHAAVFLGIPELIEYLVSKGADLEAKDKYGESPMTIALGDPEGLVYRQLGGGRYDYSFRQPKFQQNIADLLVKLGAKPFTGKRRDRSGE